AVAEAVEVVKTPPLAAFLVREVEFLSRDKIDGARCGQAWLGLDRDLSAYEPDLQMRISVLERLGNSHIGREGRRRGMHDDKLVIARQRQYVVEPQPRRRCIDKLASRHQRGRLRQPCRIPERADLAP